MGRKQNVDDGVFDEIGIKEAYFLGLLYSDGCVCETTKNRVTTSIAMDDLDTILNVKNFFKSNNKIGERKRQNGKISYSFSVNNHKLGNRLQQLGCKIRKSNIVDRPPINPSLYTAFLMGVFDGDGSLSINKSINSWKASIGTGSNKFYNWLIEWADSNRIIYSKENRTTKNGNFYLIVFTGISARYFLQLLYGSVDGVVQPMNRKQQIYNELRKQSLCGPKFTAWEIEYIQSDKSAKECADAINSDLRNYGWVRTDDTIWHKRKKMKQCTTKKP